MHVEGYELHAETIPASHSIFLGVKVPQQPNYKNNQYINHAYDDSSSSLAAARISLSRRLELLSPRRGALSLSYDSFLFGLRLVK